MGKIELLAGVYRHFYGVEAAAPLDGISFVHSFPTYNLHNAPGAPKLAPAEKAPSGFGVFADGRWLFGRNLYDPAEVNAGNLTDVFIWSWDASTDWHGALDLVADPQHTPGLPVYAAIGGEVIRVEKRKTGYSSVWVESRLPLFGRVLLVYMHLSGAGLADEGPVRAGDRIGKLGSFPGGVHLHLEFIAENDVAAVPQHMKVLCDARTRLGSQFGRKMEDYGVPKPYVMYNALYLLKLGGVKL
jgi:murein DD-endopeptidase MepM/ murein hydrolase activator NlpD